MSKPLEIIAAVLGSEADATKVVAALQTAGYVCVPRAPTPAMVEAAYWSALGENTECVWEDMIECFEKPPAPQEEKR